MKTIEKIKEDKNYTAVDLGNLDELMEYSLIHKVNKNKIEGKVFLKEATKSTGTEISFNSLAPKTEQPYFHIHYKNEESYIILKGYGFFQVDGECFEIKEGSVVRVAPDGIRGIRNDSDETMIYMVVQSRENSLEEHTTDDGERVTFDPKW
ncbi:Cupin 2 conserved barrel domain protein [Arcobacter nitrofigilis DSM 7299]|uniref:Cupin 2 conserved barrel domain protein n=1 Tax=Arcobacter nitrofigilis (strain ATCC 33309 / DSM 7299 / CCUG 15893 / LMG 7604 / NCTC 12251 / CI) TaxID=572480 RepID=D5V5G4_ARCNC|nr:cupin domain-containing protein [Arcobacter nitrofigilis]ADG93099.1 Cupin 2 conserved barrel domain protein [Arcobacter nitrofigilis DSM 7299]